MTPQYDFMIAAPLRAGARPSIDDLLASMAVKPGLADPGNPVLPFDRFPRIHFARLLLLDDRTLADRTYFPNLYFPCPVRLALLVVCDGPAKAQIDEMAAVAGDGLRRLFSHCEGFDESADLRAWLHANTVKSIAFYINWRGRTVLQSREEAVLHDVLREELAALPAASPRETKEKLRQSVARRGVKLTPEAPTPLGQWIANLVDLIVAPIIILLMTPVLIVLAPLLAIKLRRLEKANPVIAPLRTPALMAELSRYEDHDITNPFGAMGSVQPGVFRRWSASYILWLVDWAARHITTRGKLARVRTIHCARWIFLDDKKRMYFASDYDGSHEAYMDDFVNKVAFGLNLTFAPAIGIPKTRWLLWGGANRERDWKNFLRRHELPTPVWYKAYPGLTCQDLARNARLRKGLESRRDDERSIRRWLAEI
ncbi:MAG: hypothetical protein QOH04_2350 [Sphingomonadales bacterium]|nr:hypothetical protein [Sphingomonadales bacterium]